MAYDVMKTWVHYFAKILPLALKTVTHPIFGESGSKLEKRLSELKSSAASSKSAVREHVVWSGGHDIDWTGVKVLERESKEFSRRVLEAIQIKTKGPNLNRDKGLDLDPVCLGHLAPKEGRGQIMNSSFHYVICHLLMSSLTTRSQQNISWPLMLHIRKYSWGK